MQTRTSFIDFSFNFLTVDKMMQEIIPEQNPWDMFASWLAQAEASESSYANAMALATVGADSLPSVRTVLMKWFDPKGLVFYTNQQSRKGVQLAENPRASACFFWKTTKRQVRFDGDVVLVSDMESDAYFSTRPRSNQIAAWASEQSQIIESRAALEARVEEIKKRFDKKPIQRPPHWGGYRLIPSCIEFWQERNHRLHDRLVYRREALAWKQERLCP